MSTPDAPDTAGGSTSTADAASANTRRRVPGWVRTLLSVTLTVLTVLAVREYAVQNYRIPSDSMTHTLEVGDQVAVDKLTWRVTGLHRGDIVVFRGGGTFDPGGTHTDYIKRVIGLPGDVVSCCDATGRISVNGVAQDERYVNTPDGVPFGPVQVPAGQLFVLGDHRSDSNDSRYRGTVAVTAVIGTARGIIWPLTQLSRLPRH